MLGRSDCWVPSPTWDTYITHPPKAWEHNGRRGQEECENWRWRGVLWNAVFWTPQHCCVYEHSAAMLTCTRSSQATFSIEGRDAHESLPLAQELLSLTAVGIRDLIILWQFGCCRLSVPQWMTHNNMYVGSTNQTQWARDKIKVWRWAGKRKYWKGDQAI